MVLDCKELAAKLKAEVRHEVDAMVHKPSLLIVKVGHDPASEVYVRGKVKDADECGIMASVVNVSTSVTETALIDIIGENMMGKQFSGCIVQLPLPGHISAYNVSQSIAVFKDADCMHPWNIGDLVIGRQTVPPCTPSGVMRLLEHYSIPVEGKHCVVVGRSDIVGKPMASMLLNANGTVTVCHSKTKNLSDFTKTADILVVAVGKPKIITADMVKPGSTVIDVGIDRLEDGSLCGDVDFEHVKDIAANITPVPKGVGLLTRAMLMKNVLELHKNMGFIYD